MQTKLPRMLDPGRKIFCSTRSLNVTLFLEPGGKFVVGDIEPQSQQLSAENVQQSKWGTELPVTESTGHCWSTSSSLLLIDIPADDESVHSLHERFIERRFRMPKRKLE